MSDARNVDGIIEEVGDAFHAAPRNGAKQHGSILTEAAATINGPRREAYGSVEESFTRVARTWSDILKVAVTPQHVALCMVALKLHREANKHSRDNLVDLCGYAALLDQLHSKP